MTPFPFVLQTNGKRADTLHIKEKLASVLPTPQGETYWTAFGQFLTGKLSRLEFELATDDIFNNYPTAANLHNALVLAIFFNATAISGPQNTSKHAGWFNQKRKLDHAHDSSVEQARKKRLKAAVMALGKRERMRLKALPHHAALPMTQAAPISPLLSTSGSQQAMAPDVVARWNRAPTCSEQRDLPTIDDVTVLTERMSAVACQQGCSAGVTEEAASIVAEAVQDHLHLILKRVRAAYVSSAASRPLSLSHFTSLLEMHPDLLGPAKSPISSKLHVAVSQQHTESTNKDKAIHEMAVAAEQATETISAEDSTVIDEEDDPQSVDIEHSLAEQLFPSQPSERGLSRSALPSEAMAPPPHWQLVDTKSLFNGLLD